MEDTEGQFRVDIYGLLEQRQYDQAPANGYLYRYGHDPLRSGQ